MKKMYQNPQSEVVKTVAYQMQMVKVSGTTGGGQAGAPRRIPKSI